MPRTQQKSKTGTIVGELLALRDDVFNTRNGMWAIPQDEQFDTYSRKMGEWQTKLEDLALEVRGVAQSLVDEERE